MTVVPKRGEIWLVNLDPSIGAEIQKTRSAIVLSSDYIGKLPLKLVIPITDWKAVFATHLWHIRLEPSQADGLSKTSAADVLQTRSVDIRRFVRRIGTIRAQDLGEITAALVAVIEHNAE
jgi:mRNA interferase MazF